MLCCSSMLCLALNSPAAQHCCLFVTLCLLHRVFCLQLFREAMLSQDFQEIHTPKLIAGASEGGAAVFRCAAWGTCTSRVGCLLLPGTHFSVLLRGAAVFRCAACSDIAPDSQIVVSFASYSFIALLESTCGRAQLACQSSKACSRLLPCTQA
jgi:hypothetical protein